MDKLGDEKVRWQKQAESIEKEFKLFPIDSLIAAAFTTYLSDADENVREKISKEWKQQVRNVQFDYLKFMTTESKF